MRRGRLRFSPALLASPYKGGGLDPAAAALIARFETPPTAARRSAINAAFVALRAAGLLTKLDALYVMAAADRQSAKLNWIADAYNLVEVDGANLTFTADVGFQGNGTSSALNTTFAPSTAVSPKFTQNSASLGFRSETAGQANTVEIGNDNALIQCRTTGNVLNHRVNSASTGSVIAVGDGSGFFVSSRTASTAASNIAYRDGVPLAVNTNPGVSASVSARPIWLLGRNDTTPNYSARIGSLAFIGAGLTAQEVTDLFNVFG